MLFILSHTFKNTIIIISFKSHKLLIQKNVFAYEHTITKLRYRQEFAQSSYVEISTKIDNNNFAVNNN